MTVFDPIHELVRIYADQFREGFAVWLSENYHVWAAFEREASRVWNRGRRHYSARTIIEVLRHESALTDTGLDFKINDHSTPDLARLYLLVHSERRDLFKTKARVQRESKRAA